MSLARSLPPDHHHTASHSEYVDNYFIGIRKERVKGKLIWKAHFHEDGMKFENSFAFTEEGLRKAVMWYRHWMYEIDDDRDAELVPANKKVDTLAD